MQALLDVKLTHKLQSWRTLDPVHPSLETTSMNAEEDPAAPEFWNRRFRDQRIPTLEQFTAAADQLHLAAVRFTPAT